MSNEKKRAKITAEGTVQGVGFRWFVQQNARKLDLAGYVENLYSGEVVAVAEGSESMIKELHKLMKHGPSSAHVKKTRIEWEDNRDEFNSFRIEH